MKNYSKEIIHLSNAAAGQHFSCDATNSTDSNHGHCIFSDLFIVLDNTHPLQGHKSAAIDFVVQRVKSI